MKNILDIKNLSYSFGNNPILKDINIHVNENEIIAIVGSSGVGKSTLFNNLVGDKIAIVDDLPGVTRDRLYRGREWSIQ